MLVFVKQRSRRTRAEIAHRKEVSRERVIRAARTMLLERGYEGTTIRAIAREAGVSLGALYTHFENKTDLVFYLIRGTLDTLYEEVVRETARHDRGVDRVAAFVRSVIEISMRNPDQQRLIDMISKQVYVGARDEERPRDGTFLEVFHESVVRLATLVEEAVEAARREGDLNPAIDATALAPTLLHSVLTFVRGVGDPRNPFLMPFGDGVSTDYIELSNTFARLIIDGLQNR